MDIQQNNPLGRSPYPKQPSLLDKIVAEEITKEDFAREVMKEVYCGLHAYCSIPDAYTSCKLATGKLDIDSLNTVQCLSLIENPPGVIVNPEQVHREAIEFFKMILSGDRMVCEDGDPLKPLLGAYLYGPPGVGKTHIMAAFAGSIRKLLDQKLANLNTLVSERIGDMLEEFLLNQRHVNREETKRYSLDTAGGGGETLHEEIGPEPKFWKDLEILKEKVAEYRYQPTDVLYLGFDALYEFCRKDRARDDALAAIEKARYVFIDDAHPKNDPERAQVIQHLIERRYELGRFGTFLTTNISIDSIGGKDQEIGKRLDSRRAEAFINFDFANCKDWRKEIKARKSKTVLAEIHRRLEKQDPQKRDTDIARMLPSSEEG